MSDMPAVFQGLTNRTVNRQNIPKEGPVQLEFEFMRHLDPDTWHITKEGRFHRVSSSGCAYWWGF